MAKKTRKAKTAKPKKKPVKKRATVKKRSPKKKVRATQKSRAVKKKKVSKKQAVRHPELPAEPIGRVTHYFPQARAVAVMIENGNLKVGDTLYFKGHTTNFKQVIHSLQINRQPVTGASPGDEVGIRVKSRTREHDLVFKL